MKVPGQQDGSGPGAAIPVRDEAAIAAWLKQAGGQAFAQATHRYGDRLYRGMQVIGRDGRRRRVWFDVTSFAVESLSTEPEGVAGRLRGALRTLFSR